jgi:hypothetical protein
VRGGWAKPRRRRKANRQTCGGLYRGRFLRRTLLILAVRFGADRVLRGCASGMGSGCGWGCGWGCVLRTASANISCSSALVGVEGFAISRLFFFRLRGFPRQPLGLQSFIIFPEGFLRFFVFRCRLLFTGALKSSSRFSLFECEVLPYSIAHRSPPISVTSEMTIARQRCPATKPAN